MIRSCYISPVRFFADIPATARVKWYPVPHDRPVLPFTSFVSHEPWQDLNGPAEQMYCGMLPWQQGQQYTERYGGAALPRPLPVFTGHVCGTARQWLGDLVSTRVGDVGNADCCGGPGVITEQGGFEFTGNSIWPRDAAANTDNFYSSVTFWRNVTILGTVAIGPGGLCIPVNPVCGPLDFTPDCGYIEINTCEGAIRWWDTASQQLLCLPGTACNFLPDGIDTGAGATDTGTCDCPECPQGAVSSFSFDVLSVDDPTYSGLVGRWKVTYTSGCTWLATDVDGNSWELLRSGGVTTLTGTTVGGDTAVYDVSNTCCDQTRAGLSSSSTGNLSIPQTIQIQPVGDCPDCPQPPPPPDGPGTCDCPQCPAPLGAPKTFNLDFAVALGDFAPLAGSWDLEWVGNQPNDFDGCAWNSMPVQFPEWSLTHFAGDGFWYLNGTVNGTTWVRYKCADADFLCCGESVFHLDDKRGRGIVPDACTVIAATGCDCGGGGTVTVPCYPDPVDEQLVATVIGSGTFDGDYPIAWDAFTQSWQFISTGPFGSCGGSPTPVVYMRFHCVSPPGVWHIEPHLFITGDSFIATSASSSGPLVVRFDNVGDAICGAPVGWSIVVAPKRR